MICCLKIDTSVIVYKCWCDKCGAAYCFILKRFCCYWYFNIWKKPKPWA